MSTEQLSPESRTPPQDIVAERSVLGAMLLSQDAVGDVAEELSEDDFYRPAHQLIYRVILDLFSNGEPADAVTVSAELERRNELTRVGGQSYLHSLVAEVPTAANASYYARIVREQAVLRGLVRVGTLVAQLGYEGDGDLDGLINRAQAEIFEVTTGKVQEDFVPIADIINETLDELNAIQAHDGGMTGVPTGITDLDALTNGLHPGQLVIIAARPSLGKSTLALDFARSAAIKHGLSTCFFSLEMGRNEIVMRLLSAEAKVNLQGMRTGKMTHDEYQKVFQMMDGISNAPFYIDDSPNMTMMEIRSKCRRLKQQHDLKLVIVDYMQLMTSGHRVESRQQEVSEFSRQLKLLAKEIEVPIVALSQLNRNSEQRQDKKPMLSDLRESGSLEQDADMVILIHREDFYDPESSRAGEADLIVAKHRNGPTHSGLAVSFQGQYSRFVNMAQG